MFSWMKVKNESCKCDPSCGEYKLFFDGKYQGYVSECSKHIPKWHWLSFLDGFGCCGGVRNEKFTRDQAMECVENKFVESSRVTTNGWTPLSEVRKLFDREIVDVG